MIHPTRLYSPKSTCTPARPELQASVGGGGEGGVESPVCTHSHSGKGRALAGKHTSEIIIARRNEVEIAPLRRSDDRKPRRSWFPRNAFWLIASLHRGLGDAFAEQMFSLYLPITEECE